MHPSVRTILRFIGASVVGYLVIALGQTLVLEVGLKGRVGPNSPFPILGLAAFGTIVSGLIGGYLAGWLGGWWGGWVVQCFADLLASAEAELW